MKDLDKKILQILQEDSEISMEELGSRLNLSSSPCYRRVKNLKDKGYIDKSVAVLNKKKLNLERPYFVHVKTTSHNKEWTDQFKRIVKNTPQIVECHRLMGEVDYLLKVRLKNSESYNEFYFNLINKINFASISGFPSLEELKETNVLPLDYI
ncbi:MAG: ArsR family transcriptional regulator [Pelagibacteraceae bacterium TMED136]|nr:MAG: ArsR family transcriptional regulator [Pelagibacteraceae bacterium TMED136]|tara:strand:- start:2451 stop:2909 length:459 start_codon:yes stop_codon:yes gene_type:complete